MTKMTLENILRVLIQTYEQRNWHEDFIELNKKKLKIMNDVLFNKELILFDGKNFSFKTNKDNVELSYATYLINETLSKIISEKELCKGETTTTKEIINFKNEINLITRNAIIRSHSEQLIKVYKDVLWDSLKYIYYVPFQFKEEVAKEIEEKGIVFNQNEELSKEQAKIFNKQLDSYNYF